MRTVRATELKANLSTILGDVERGETVVVERHGRPIAHLIPATSRNDNAVSEAIAGMRALREALPKSRMTVQDILDARHEGHRY